MSNSVFAPKFKPTQEGPQSIEGTSTSPEPTDPKKRSDTTGGMLLRIAQYTVIGSAGLIPVFFTPGILASLGFDKTLLVVVFNALAIVLIALVALRRSHTKTVLPWALFAFFGVVGVAVVSALLTGDTQDALRGSVLEPQTAGFLGVLAVTMMVPLVLQGSGGMALRALGLFLGGSALVLVYTLLRIVLGGDALTFGAFADATRSPVGGLNDVGVLAALLILVSLITLAQLPLGRASKMLFAGLSAVSLSILAIVNVFNLWAIVGFFSLLLLVYLVSRDTMFRSDTEDSTPVSKTLLGVTAGVCVVSAIFVMAGQFVGGQVSQLTGIDYLEVRPSFTATVDIARSVYSENVLLGSGPNRFADAWRLHKDPSINQTVFWDTDFQAGSGFVPTLFVNLGVLGGFIFMLFHAFLILIGYRMLVRNTNTASSWYYFGLVSFTATVFLWGMSYVYVPGTTLLLLAALFTGFTFAAYGALVPERLRSVPLVTSRQRGFALMALAILIITATVGTVLSVGEQYAAQANFTEARLTAESVETFTLAAQESYDLYPDERFISAQAQVVLAELSTLVGVAEPSEEQQQRFLTLAERAVVLAERTVAADPTNPDHYALQAGVFNVLALAGIDGADERLRQSLNRARTYDPFNPAYDLLEAQLAAQVGDAEAARAEIGEALALKRNFTPALYLLAQIDVADGDVESAIATTRAIITLEPNNPTRYFQLGVLLSSNEQNAAAINAFRSAIARDPEYANARYLLALAYLAEDSVEPALEELRLVQQTNQENQQLAALIEQLESGESFDPPELGLDTPVSEAEVGEPSTESVVTDEVLDSDLVTPVNNVAGEESASSEIISNENPPPAESEPAATSSQASE